MTGLAGIQDSIATRGAKPASSSAPVGSSFAQAAPVEDEEEAWQFVEDPGRHREATRNVYAWRVGLADELITTAMMGAGRNTSDSPVILEVIQREAPA